MWGGVWSHHTDPPNAILSLAPCWAAGGSLPRPGSHCEHEAQRNTVLPLRPEGASAGARVFFLCPP